MVVQVVANVVLYYDDGTYTAAITTGGAGSITVGSGVSVLSGTPTACKATNDGELWAAAQAITWSNCAWEKYGTSPFTFEGALTQDLLAADMARGAATDSDNDGVATYNGKGGTWWKTGGALLQGLGGVEKSHVSTVVTNTLGASWAAPELVTGSGSGRWQYGSDAVNNLLPTSNSIGYIYGASAAGADLNSYLTNHGCQNQYLFLTGYVPYGADSSIANSITAAVSTAVTPQTIDGCMILNVLDLVSGVDVGDGGALGAALSGTTGFSNIGMANVGGTAEDAVNVHTDTTCVGTLFKDAGNGGVAINNGYSGFNVPIANAFATKLKAACGGTNDPFADSSDAIAVGDGVTKAAYAVGLTLAKYTLGNTGYHLLGTCGVDNCDAITNTDDTAQAPNVRLVNGAAGDLVDFSILPYSASGSVAVTNIVPCLSVGDTAAQLSFENCVTGSGYCPIMTGDQWAGGGVGVLYDDNNDPGLVYSGAAGVTCDPLSVKNGNIPAGNRLYEYSGGSAQQNTLPTGAADAIWIDDTLATALDNVGWTMDYDVDAASVPYADAARNTLYVFLDNGAKATIGNDALELNFIKSGGSNVANVVLYYDDGTYTAAITTGGAGSITVGSGVSVLSGTPTACEATNDGELWAAAQAITWSNCAWEKYGTSPFTFEGALAQDLLAADIARGAATDNGGSATYNGKGGTWWKTGGAPLQGLGGVEKSHVSTVASTLGSPWVCTRTCDWCWRC